MKLGPKPKETPVKAAKEGMKSSIFDTKNWAVGILNQTKMDTPIAASNRRTTTLGNFRFSPEVTIQNSLSPTEEITSKAPREFDTFVTIKTAPLDEGETIGEKFVLEQFRVVCENLWAADPNMVIYPFPGKIQHSSRREPSYQLLALSKLCYTPKKTKMIRRTPFMLITVHTGTIIVHFVYHTYSSNGK